MGPSCEVILETPLDGEALRALDVFLTGAAERIVRTRKGRVWEACIEGRWVHVAVSGSLPEIVLWAGFKSPEDYEVLRWLGSAIAEMFGGLASEPVK